MPEAIASLLPLHWIRPWALWGLPLALLLLIGGRVQGHSGVPKGVVDAHLLPHLLVRPRRTSRLRPTDTLAAALAFFCIAMAGPAWQKQAAPLAAEKAPLMLVIDLSEAMQASDLAPSRLEHARSKLQRLLRLLRQRGDAPTGLIVYAGSAHLVLPPTQDQSVLTTYLDALSTDLMPTQGLAPARALALALQWLERSPVPGTVLFLTAEWPAADLARTQALLASSRHKMLIWAMGTPEGGALRNVEGRLLTDAQGRSRTARLDTLGLQALREHTAAPLVMVSPDTSDLHQIQALIARHSEASQENDPARRWDDSGPAFLWPGLAALLWSLRRGWVIPQQTLAALLACCLTLALCLSPGPSKAQGLEPTPSSWFEQFLGWWLTPDQQGRWWLERGDLQRAARHFSDPFWLGLTHARAENWQAAADAFARVDSAAGWFNQGHMLARAGRYADAVAAYDQALLRMPGWPEALADRDKLRTLLPPDPPEDKDGADLQPGESDGNEPGQRRPTKTQAPRRLTEAEIQGLWLQRLDTSPAGFLRRKFALEAAPAKADTTPKAVRP